MGLHLNFELRLPGATASDDVTGTLRDLRAVASELPFRSVSELYQAPRGASGTDWGDAESLRFWASVIARPYPDDDPPLIGDVTTAQAFFVHPGERCETASFGLLLRAAENGQRQEWFWHCSCKTQYASVVSDRHLVTCHTGLVRLLEHAKTLGMDVVVRDETHYWETRDEQRLIEEVHRMNQIVARIAGTLSDAVDQGPVVRAPIFAHPRFERLEMGEDGEE